MYYTGLYYYPVWHTDTRNFQLIVRKVLKLQLLKQSLPKAQFQILKDMNHVLKTCESVDMQVQQATYANPDLPVQEDLLITIEKFVKR
jgi:hypothetical protein